MNEEKAILELIESRQQNKNRKQNAKEKVLRKIKNRNEKEKKTPCRNKSCA